MAQKVNQGSDTGVPISIGKPALRALEVAGFTKLAQLTKISESELLKLHGVGPKAIRLLQAALRSRGLTFRKSE